MIIVELFDPAYQPDGPLLYSIIAARQDGLWLFVRHRERSSWEVPGGHIEEGETADQAAVRELHEETGATDFEIECKATYKVSDGKYSGYGRLYLAEVFSRGAIPQGSEIAEVITREKMPDNLTHPEIQPVLFRHVAGIRD
ncbi:MAG: NUDIX domain-containing protein [Bacteroidales bacterium]|nr:NUDIX domain-containing protein [Bacteroidales bacterium]